MWLIPTEYTIVIPDPLGKKFNDSEPSESPEQYADAFGAEQSRNIKATIRVMRFAIMADLVVETLFSR